MCELNVSLEFTNTTQSVSSKKPGWIQRPAGKRAIRVDMNPTLVGSYEILLSSVLVLVDVFMCKIIPFIFRFLARFLVPAS